MDDLFSAFNDDVRHVVRHTAKMAVLSSQEEQPTDGNDSVRVLITQLFSHSSLKVLVSLVI